MNRSRTLREVALSHQQNHAMLLILLRRAEMPMMNGEAERFAAELAEIDERVQAIARASHQRAVAAMQDQADRRIRERRLGDRRVQP
jgi:hypothetical protein